MTGRSEHALALRSRTRYKQGGDDKEGHNHAVTIDIGGATRWRIGDSGRSRSIRPGHVQQTSASDFAEELPGLSPARPNGADVFSHVRKRAPLGESHESRRGHPKNAPLVGRPALWPLPERPVLEAGRDRYDREVG